MHQFSKPFVAVALVGFLWLLSAEVRAQFYTIQLAPQAQSLEQVTMHITSLEGGIVCNSATAAMAANTITVTIACDIFGFPEQPPFPASSFDVELGRFPPGTYQVVVVGEGEAAGRPPINTSFTVTERHNGLRAGTFPVVDFTDHWWDPQESGWGISIDQHISDGVFAAWFLYNQSGQPTWYTLYSAHWTTSTSFSGPVYRTTGPYFGGPFDPTQVGYTAVGTATLTFNDASSGTFSYTVEGVSGSKPISRLPF